MPEGPEIRRAADEVAAVLEGQVVETVRFGLPRLKRSEAPLRGHRVRAVETRGKAMLVHFEHGLSLYSHNQLYGVWRVIEGHELPQSKRSLRVLLQTAKHSALLYSASDISVWPVEELVNHPFLARIGPDIMSAGLTWQAIAERLQSPRFARRNLGSLYLDQQFVAGIGNYLRSEILHAAQLHPLQRAAELGAGERGRLARATLTISLRSYRTEGVTLGAALARSLARQSLPWEQRRFAVFGRAELPCYRCGAPVVRREINTRRLYLCLQYQPAP